MMDTTSARQLFQKVTARCGLLNNFKKGERQRDRGGGEETFLFDIIPAYSLMATCFFFLSFFLLSVGPFSSSTLFLTPGAQHQKVRQVLIL